MMLEDYSAESDYYDDDGYLYDSSELDYEHDNYDDFNPFHLGTTIFEMCQQCIEPTVSGAIRHVLYPIVYCLIFTAITRLTSLNEFKFHLLSCVSGYLCLAHLFHTSAIMTVVLSFCSFLIARRNQKSRTEVHFWIALRIYLAYMVFREYFEIRLLKENWSQVRGIHMLFLLRTLSLDYEFSKGTRAVPLTFLEYNGYMLCPATVLFGPWIPYSSYLKIRQNSDLGISWSMRIVVTFICSLLCLSMSSCGVYWIFFDINSRWMFAIRDAMSVRFSHYFISYMSEAMCLLSGFYSSDGELTQSVANPLSIEFPRSLVEVVISWNKPMHKWLKYFIFRPTHVYGPLKAVLYTFLVSSMLHGLYFPVTMVLLTLGLSTYVEYTTREKLANVFDACIRSRKCGSNCHHKNKSTSIPVILTNLLFSLLSYFHLVYIGVMMDVKETDGRLQPLSLMSTQLERWNNLGFASHWVTLIMYIAMSLV